MRTRVRLFFVCLIALSQTLSQAEETDTTPAKTRVLILTDVGAEVDDSQSFVRFLLYAHQFDVEGLIATTSTWQRDKVQPDLLRERIAAYAEVWDSLNHHAQGYPSPEALQAVVRAGTTAFGMAGVGKGKQTAASKLIIDAVDASEQPLWVIVWGGAADLAQALWEVRDGRAPEDVAVFVSKLRVYTISDQDDAGPWMRANFRDLFCISSVHGWNQYYSATWVGISGDLLVDAQWPDREWVTNEWLEHNIRKGPLGALYPLSRYIMEGDTPSFLGLINNGLNVPERPDYGGWGGRYVPANVTGGHYSDSYDRWVDADGELHLSNHATIFRWRKAFQTDFAARVRWTMTADFSAANHHPVARVNGSDAPSVPELQLNDVGSVVLDAGASSDPDGDTLSYRWWVYQEPSGYPSGAPVTLKTDGHLATLTVDEGSTLAGLHVILEVTDDGEPALTSYRRIILRTGASDDETP